MIISTIAALCFLLLFLYSSGHEGVDIQFKPSYSVLAYDLFSSIDPHRMKFLHLSLEDSNKKLRFFYLGSKETGTASYYWIENGKQLIEYENDGHHLLVAVVQPMTLEKN